MASRPLIVATVAGVLLVALLVADATMNRALFLDVRDGEGWRQIASDGYHESDARAHPVGARVVDANDTVEMRLRVDNTYAWAYEDTYRAYANGVEIASGIIQAPARGQGEAVFSFAARAAADEAGGRAAPDAPDTRVLFISVDVGGYWLYTDLEVRGASA